MTSQEIKTAIADCDELMLEACQAIDNPAEKTDLQSQKKIADATNRLAIATGLHAKATLGLQLETVILREKMAQAYSEGKSMNPDDLNRALQGEDTNGPATG